ncbi:cold-shock DNA-binding family protein [Mycobacteroides abscessus]|uniref:cold-shock protein n=1 Tax=Mycobacteroides abscessus TaxID=36809 RepID=UPI000369FFF1|nr:cold shock domain-containing protein [Mycobacteroides abscessus]CPT29877.1 cold-shock DNA-binding family protein [Mycobacteroides abscessus]CPU32936.1 cold-shock DNA-binding family protein [Mycobacteroides abscessus]SKQ33609.1 cold-shock DNA-binding family protein [Mycobacteroides abscessus subsp. massiliense]SKR21256.1 cold-shock DNA-binding family protein [Mycobacteroides abscessus subsp. massiliense]SKR37411.1 cold-shock DNA-binding family protein [Mycobacteroides abscessus subsp. massil
MAHGIVKFFKPEKGWGAIISPAMPDGLDAFAHLHLEGEGFRMLSEGGRVEFDYGRTASDTSLPACVSSDCRRTDGWLRTSARASSWKAVIGSPELSASTLSIPHLIHRAESS